MNDEDKKDTISINTTEIKRGFSNAIDFFKNKKVQNILIIVLLLAIIIFGVWIRTQNLDLLVDQTTGKYIPLALDPYYFLRIAETSIEQSDLPEIDIMRQPSSIFNGGVPFSSEIIPKVVVLLFNIGKIFDKDITIQYIDIISPVIFFILGLVIFFFLIYFLTKSKLTALIGSIFLAIIPTYLYRTMTGFSDHESIGMFAFFLTLLGYTLALKFLNKEEIKKNFLLKIILFGFLIGFLSAFTIVSWGGIANFLFMIIPLSFGLLWFVKIKNLEENKKYLSYFLIFYFIWFISTILFGSIFGFSLTSIINKVTLNSTSLINGVVLLFVISDFFMVKFGEKIPIRKVKKYRLVFSAGIVVLLGILFSIIIYGNFFPLVKDIIGRLLHPFGTGRVGLTVAENKAPYLKDWMNQTGKILFWLFLGGLVLIGANISKAIKKHGRKIGFIFFWVLLILGILFSKFSSNSIFNGTNFISGLFYFGSIVVFGIYCIRFYYKEKLDIKPELIIIFSWTIFMLIAARGAIRLFFVITPFVCFSVGIFISSLAGYYKKSRDDLGKMLLGILLIGVIIASLFSFFSLATASVSQAKYTGPSANLQWQQAMTWVRENTPKNAIFLHWWDYGYWVQYLGQRPTLSDGGHFQGEFRNHMVGRYVLTTPHPETALSFMKTNNASYLLIDSTDLGKYTAYSSIGSDEIGEDRLSQIPTMLSDKSQVQETKNGEIRVYRGGALVDQDIVYNADNTQIFLPAQRAVIIGIIAESIENPATNKISFKQPTGIFIYNNQQYRIPLRYVYFNGQVADFKNGMEEGVMIIPRINQVSGRIQLDVLGASIYLSPKVFKSLFVQLYLMDDYFNNYSTIKLAHGQDDPVISSLKAQGLEIGEFAYFNGFKGPIKIWNIRDIPDNILIREEFLRRQGDWAEFDNLQFVK